LKTADLRPFVERALAWGADEVRIIKASSIRCEAWVRFKCQFGCGGYNKRLTCPPFTPTPEETAKVVAGYGRGILLHSDDNEVVNDIVPRLEREIFLSGYFKAVGFGSGPCRFCERCDTLSLCKHPYRARPSMEACGIDVFTTVRANRMGIRVVRTRREAGNYYGLILVD
jgi:predicted metal-binding protein